MKKQTKGFILGAALGVGAGLLFAPYRGVTMRKKVASKLNAVTDYVKNMNSETLRSDCLGILNNIKGYLEELDSAKLKSDAILVGSKLKKEVNKLATKVKEVSEPVVAKAIEDLRCNTVVLLKKTVEKLEN